MNSHVILIRMYCITMGLACTMIYVVSAMVQEISMNVDVMTFLKENVIVTEIQSML